MRNKILLTAIALLVAFGVAEVKALQGGPDIYGYIWKDSGEPDVNYNWVDITGRPGAVQVSGLADDNAVGPFNIGFDFHYYWNDLNQVKLGSNGWLSFDNVGNIASCFPTIPTQGGAGDNILAPYMSDLTFISGYAQFPNIGEMWYWTNNVDSFVLQLIDVPWWKNDNGGASPPDWEGANTFEVILDGQDSSITFQYQFTDDNNFNTNACPTNMEIGMENVTGNIGLQVFTGANLPADNYAVKFIYPDSVTFQVPDATPAWNANSDNAGQFFLSNTNVDLETNIANVGNTDITNTINVDGEIRSLALQQVWSDNSSIPSLVAGQDQTVTFGTQLNLTNPGQYYYNVDISNSQDINPSNNSNSVEVSAVDGGGGFVSLSYATQNPPDGVISWAGGGLNDGVAQKMVPPAMVTIDTVQMWIEGDGDVNTPMPVGFTMAIYDDNNGNPGNLVQMEAIAAGAIAEGAWNDVVLDTSISFQAGEAFYVAWLQGGTGVALGTEDFGPISRRGYEILGGAWSTFRNATTTEFLINVNGGIAVSTDPGQSLSMDMTTYPNPTSQLAFVNYEVTQMGTVDFALMNTVGQTVWHKQHGNVAAGNHQFNIDVTSFAAGVYFLRMNQGNQVITKKLIVE